MKLDKYLMCLALLGLTSCNFFNQTLIAQPSQELSIQKSNLKQQQDSNMLFPILSKGKTTSEGNWNQDRGYIDQTGKIVIKPQFNLAYPFKDGMAVVSLEGKDGYIDKTGTLIIPPQFDGAEPFFEGMAAIRINDKWGYINQQGEIVIKPQFDKVQEFSQGLAAVKIGENWGYIDKIGKIVIPLHFKNADSFSEGLAVSRIRCSDAITKIDCNDNIGELDDSRYGFIDSSGKLAIKTTFFTLRAFQKD